MTTTYLKFAVAWVLLLGAGVLALAYPMMLLWNMGVVGAFGTPPIDWTEMAALETLTVVVVMLIKTDVRVNV